jgi:transposase
MTAARPRWRVFQTIRNRAATASIQRRQDDMGKQQKSTKMRRGQRKGRAKLKPRDCTLGLEVVHPKAAGIDVGNEEHWVAVPAHLDAEPVRQFGCFTGDLVVLATWLKGLGIETVAMQSTGVYGIALYEILEQTGMRVFVVNARDTKNLPGRKTDIAECQWLLKLHVYGLLRNSFRPAEDICVLRSYWRQRQQHIGDASRCVQRMQKALTQMNVQLANVISDITGATGQAIIKAILGGERNPRRLAPLCQAGIQASQETVAASLEGNWREELLFVLRQEVGLYGEYQRRIEECDEALNEHFQKMPAKADAQTLAVVRREKRAKGNVPENMDLRKELYRISGVDLTAIDGINVLTAQTILAEVGPDMGKFETEAHFVSWLGLCPNNRISGGKIIGRERRKTVNRGAVALRIAASTLLRSQTYLGSQYRRFRTKLGAPKAMKAMASRLARIIYRMLKHGEAYVDKGQEFYEQKYRQQQIRMLTRKATELGLQLVPSN